MISFEFVAEHFEELEADFQREYGINLREALYGLKPIGARRLTALIVGLSPDSATMRKANSDGKQWGTTEELLATLCELVDLTNRLLYSANFDTKKQPTWDPIEIPRPYAEVKRSRLSSTDEVRALFTSGDFGVVVYDPSGAPDSSSNGEVTDSGD